MLVYGKTVGHPACIVEAQREVQIVLEDPKVLFQKLAGLLPGDGHPFVHSGGMAPADGPDTGRTLVGVLWNRGTPGIYLIEVMLLEKTILSKFIMYGF